MRAKCTIWIGLCALVACSHATSKKAPTDTSEPTTPRTPTPGDPSGGAPSGSGSGGGSASGSSGGSSSGGPSDPGDTGVPYVDFDINHIVSTGQSNSVSHGGIPPLSMTQPYANLSFDVGVMTMQDCEDKGCRTYQQPSTFVPLVEGDSFWWPVETMSNGLADEATKLAHEKYGMARHDILVSLAGRNGLTYWCLRKGTCNFVDPAYLVSYDETMKQVADAKRIAAAMGKSYVVRVATAIHGESDDFGYAQGTPEFPLDGTDGVSKEDKTYADGVLEWQRDLEAGIRAITGQSQPIPLLISQFSGWNDAPTSAVSIYQYEAHVRSNGKVVLVAPGYMLDWASDCRHYSSDGERRLGEYFAKVYARIVIEGKKWEPVRPKSVTLSGTTITAQYWVPAPPLVLDTTRVVDPGDYGFEVVSASGARIPITNVSVTAPDTVTIQVASAGAARLRYAFTHPPMTCTGHVVGARGNLRDSDATPSQYGYELFNWGVHFDLPVQ
ncbi:MAG TPA: hypothetical protein VIF62_11950 [Labilithrix sp.]|jgi:hypothetical protein